MTKRLAGRHTEQNHLAEYIDKVLQNRRRGYRTQRDLSQGIGMHESGFCRAVQDQGTLSVEQCLRLAYVLRVDPVAILQLAKRSPIADILKEMTRVDPNGLTRRERELLEQWRSTNATTQQTIETLLVLLHGASATNARSSSRAAAHERALVDARRREDLAMESYRAGSPTRKTSRRRSASRHGSASNASTKRRKRAGNSAT